MKSNFDELKKIHADREHKLGKEIQRPNPDHIIMTRIKRFMKIKSKLLNFISKECYLEQKITLKQQ